jgi:exopolyphosphatase/guanosine-5'-triphosphate,3'-diphosphate pyrophosphatase
VSGNGLRDGWFYKQYSSLWKRPVVMYDVLAHSLDNIMKRYEVNRAHSAHVTLLSLKLFDNLKVFHGFTDAYRKLIKASALLHDVGMYIEYYNHHKHGFYLTMNSRLCGLSNTEIVSCAYLVGMHRNEKLKVELDQYAGVVDKREFKRLNDLALLLGISEKLDRSESGTIEDIEIEIEGSEVVIKLFSKDKPALEMAAASEYISKFKASFGVELSLEYAGSVQ